MLQAMIVILLLTLPAVAALRAVLGRRVQALMLKLSPRAASSSPASSRAPEVEAGTALRVIRLDAAAVSPELTRARHAATRHSRSLFRRWCAYDAAAVAGVLVLWYLAQSARAGGDESVLRDMSHPVKVSVGIYWTLVGLRYILHIGDYGDRAIRGMAARGWFRRDRKSVV